MWKPLSQSQTDITKIWSLHQTFHINKKNDNISNTAYLKVFAAPLLNFHLVKTREYRFAVFHGHFFFFFVAH